MAQASLLATCTAPGGMEKGVPVPVQDVHLPIESLPEQGSQECVLEMNREPADFCARIFSNFCAQSFGDHLGTETDA